MKIIWTTLETILIKTLLNITTALIYVNNNVRAMLSMLKKIKSSVNTLKLSVYVE